MTVKVSACTVSEAEGVDIVFSNPLGSHSFRRLAETFMCLLFFGPNLLQLLQRKLQCCFTARLRKYFTNFMTSPEDFILLILSEPFL